MSSFSISKVNKNSGHVQALKVILGRTCILGQVVINYSP